jgi:hypothetical protein
VESSEQGGANLSVDKDKRGTTESSSRSSTVEPSITPVMGHVHVPYARTRTYETLKSTYDVRTCVCVRSTPPVRPQNLLHPSDQAKSLLFRTSTFEEMHRQKKNAVATSTTRAADAETSSSSVRISGAIGR